MTEPMNQLVPSLLPYVDSGKAGLHLRLVTEDQADLGRPARLANIGGAGPFASIVHATISVAGRLALADLFLLVQPDQYSASTGDGARVTNVDVENLWQAAAVQVSALYPQGPSPFLPEQTDSQGRLVPWRSLFYCRHQRRYAHPLCPHCGSGLVLCRDDGLLRDVGLPGYSKSLARFLHCPLCLQDARRRLFYAPTAAPGGPAQVVGCHGLIEGFGRLLGLQKLAVDLPCTSCDQGPECYGPRRLAHRRMGPLLFFPSFMLPQPVPREHALSALLQMPPAAATPQAPAHQVLDDHQIAGIVRTVLANWMLAEPSDKPELRETVILGDEGKLAASTSWDPEATIILPAAQEGEGPRSRPKDPQVVVPQRPQGYGKRGAVEEVEETVLISDQSVAPMDDQDGEPTRVFPSGVDRTPDTEIVPRNPSDWELVAELRRAYAAAPDSAAEMIESLLHERLAEVPAPRKRDVLLRTLELLGPPEAHACTGAEKVVLGDLMTRLLGHSVMPEDLSSQEMLERLVRSLNTVFNKLNQLVASIDRTLYGNAALSDKTIRGRIIEDPTSLEAYLGKLTRAFSDTQLAFMGAARTQVERVLDGLDPEKIPIDGKFVSLRKGKTLGVLKNKANEARLWLDSDRFEEDLLREVEEQCRRLSRR